MLAYVVYLTPVSKTVKKVLQFAFHPNFENLLHLHLFQGHCVVGVWCQIKRLSGGITNRRIFH